jgi:FlaA1/EpsC-like NDP-sugar epimerase/lipopolysaccharide/colanic/teichoic acid biosynthesis glycosyltransferase
VTATPDAALLRRMRRLEQAMRVVDLLLASVALVLAAPLLLLLMALVRFGTRSARGPALFAQERIGRGGRTFRLWKLRTMVVDAERIGPRLTGRDDPRVTRLGRWLRRTKLDELPQLWNVVRGEMSLVGPRPEVAEMVRRAPAEYGALLRVRPGLLSEAALRFRREEELLPGQGREEYYVGQLLPRKLELDLRWLARRTLLGDLELLLRAALLLLRIKRDETPLTLPGDARLRNGAKLLLDGAVVAASWWSATALRFDGLPDGVDGERLVVLTLPLVATTLVTIVLSGGLRSIWRYFVPSDFGRLTLLHLPAPLALTAWRALLPARLALLRAPYSVIALTYLLALLGSAALRCAWSILRARAERRSRPRPALAGRIAIVGAGRTALAVVHELERSAGRDAELLACFDDAPGKRGTRVAGIPVAGTLAELPEWLARTRPDHLLIAIAALPEEKLRPLVDAAHLHGVALKIVPSLLERARTPTAALRDLSIADLIGRPPVRLDPRDESIAGAYRDRVVLVTGAAGSIGSELVRQLARLGPKRLVLLDKDENGLFELGRELDELAPGLSRELAVLHLGGGRADRRAVARLLRRARPQVVLHAAAHKHVPLMEQNAVEAVVNNAFATRDLARLAAGAKALAFVMISTDKAVRPTSVMGASKRVAELVVRDLGRRAARHGTRFSVVRFGNVLASRGSVVETFLRQLERGLPLTITHPEVERYFLTIPEAAQLVLVAGSLPEPRGHYVLDMGRPRRIVDLARDVARLAGRAAPPELCFVGLRPGEKLHEELSVSGRLEHVPGRDGVLVDAEPAPPRDELDALLAQLARAVRRGDAAAVRRALALPRVGLAATRPAAAPAGRPLREGLAAARD